MMTKTAIQSIEHFLITYTYDWKSSTIKINLNYIHCLIKQKFIRSIQVNSFRCWQYIRYNKTCVPSSIIMCQCVKTTYPFIFFFNFTQTLGFTIHSKMCLLYLSLSYLNTTRERNDYIPHNHTNEYKSKTNKEKTFVPFTNFYNNLVGIFS